MSDLPESEARDLLQQRLLCVDPDEWIRSREHAGVYRIEAGLITANGEPTNLSVELQCLLGKRATSFRLTVLLHEASGRPRVYQLEINQSRQRSNDRHRWSHEHIGTMRYLGPERWDSWGYDEVFRYFCGQTNIDFQPFPRPPDRFPRRKKS